MRNIKPGDSIFIGLYHDIQLPRLICEHCSPNARNMPSTREKRLPSSSSRLEFVDKRKEKSPFSKRCFVRLILGLSLVAIALIVVVIVVWFRPSTNSKNSAENNDIKQCSFSEEARRIDLKQFLEKLQFEFYKHHPHLIALKPGVTLSEVRQFYRPYDFRPEAIKNATDKRAALYNELQTGIFAEVDESKLVLRERKAIYVAKSILKVSFGWSPYGENYYSADWLLGPNIFCWQAVCNMLSRLQVSLPYFKPVSFADIQVLHGILKQHNSSIRQYNDNIRGAAKIGMVRSVEACEVGVREFKKNFLSIAISNGTGKQ